VSPGGKPLAGRLALALAALVAIEALVLGLDAALPPPLARAMRSSPVVLDHDGAWLMATPVEGGRWRLRADLARTDPTYVRRVIALEDARFYWHFGVDPAALARAAVSMARHGRPTSGASTLTMQTARLLEPRSRTVLAKAIEMLRALQLEARFSKREILALYLTLAPYGGNLEGVRAASLAWFGHEPAALTDAEQALLIALPQSPEARRPDRHPLRARRARARVLARLARAGAMTLDQAREAASEPTPRRAAFPALAWQAAREVARTASATDASVVSTLDADLQSRLERLAAETARSQGPDGQAAVIAVRIEGRAVVACVGTSGRDRPGGWIDMTLAPRSPGSALKPFIYALAFDAGLVAPDTQIDDAPRRFADYQPEDFDRIFHGRVTVREALIHSLNVPAVAVLERIGPAVFEARLRAAGVRLARPKTGFADPGLALALGGEGLSLRDLVLLYAALGDGGLAKPLAWTDAEAKGRAAEPGVRLLGADAARTALDILREAPLPAGRTPAALTRGSPALAFKTGTSYGFRDAVAAGVVDGYAIAVWTGRADGGARPGLTGHAAALPLLFDVADQLGAAPASPPPIAPRGAPAALNALERADDGPRLIFPPDGATVVAPAFGPGGRGLSLDARGEALSWYVDGAPVPTDPVSGRPLWRPAAPGFYRVTVADGAGRRAEARVRVVGAPSDHGEAQ
jgi:penicillin-binding protein 1C